MKTLKQKLEQTKRNLYINNEVFETSPKQTKGKVEFFTIGKYISDDELQKEYENRGLIPASIYDLIDNDKICDEKKYVGTHWKDENGKWCFATFFFWSGNVERSVYVDRNDGDWLDRWWFAGVRKSSKLKNSGLIETLPFELIINGIKYRRD